MFVVFQAEERGSSAKVSVFMEHFSLEHQVTERVSAFNEWTKTKQRQNKEKYKVTERISAHK